MQNLQAILERAAMQKLQTKSNPQHSFVWNAEQANAIRFARMGKSTVICGAAGSGKTTVSTHIVKELWKNIKEPLQFSTTYLKSGNPGLVVLSFTNRAIGNFRRILNEPDIPTLTIHKLLEFRPVDSQSRIFVPSYDKLRKLPHIHTIVLEESSMVSVELFQLLFDALPNPEKTQWIVLGDIQQLTPPIGKSIFRAVLAGDKFEKVELTRVYRQAGGSPILEAATGIIEGKKLAFGKEENSNGSLTIAPFPTAAIADPHCGLQFAVSGILNRYKSGKYNPDEDLIIVPFRDDRKTMEFTSNHLSKAIAKFLDDALDREVFTIQTGPHKSYWGVGDRVMFGREDARIFKIRENPSFSGFIEPPSKYIDRYGIAKAVMLEFPEAVSTEWDFQEIPSADENSEESFFSQTSHFVSIEFSDGSQKELTTASDIRNLSLAYATTAYAVQGMQAPRVFIFLHNEHSRKACNRETLYTALTRAQKECILVCDPKYLSKGVQSQLIPGNTLEEKVIAIKATSDGNIATQFGF